MTSQALAASAAGVIALVWLGSRLRADVAPEADTLAPWAPQPSNRVRALAEAIARAEGFYVPGSLPQRINNPGDLKAPGTAVTSSGLSVFESVDQGWAALYRQIGLIASGASAYYGPATTIRQMGQKWTATVSQQLAWSTTVAQQLGVSVDTPLALVLT